MIQTELALISSPFTCQLGTKTEVDQLFKDSDWTRSSQINPAHTLNRCFTLGESKFCEVNPAMSGPLIDRISGRQNISFR